MTRCFTFGVILLAFLSQGGQAFAGELKVLDQRGLVRAVRDVQTVAVVSIQTSGPAEEANLVNTDGLAAPIAPATPGAAPLGAMLLVFNGVGPGTWQLKASSPIAVKSIDIKQ